MPSIIRVTSGIFRIEQGTFTIEGGPELWSSYDGGNNGSEQTLGAMSTSGIVNFRALPNVDTDKFILGYFGAGESNFPRAAVISRSGDTVTAGAPVLLNSVNNSGERYGVGASDTNRAMALYRGTGASIDDSTDGKVLSVSGTTITPGVEQSDIVPAVNPDRADHWEIVNISADKMFALYNTSNGGFESRLFIATTSGDTITNNNEATLATNDIASDSAGVMLDSTRMFTVYKQTLGAQPDSGHLICQVHDNTTSTSFSSGSIVTVAEAQTNSHERLHCAIRIDDNNVALIYGSSTINAPAGRTFIRFVNITGTTINSVTAEATLDDRLWFTDGESDVTFSCTPLTGGNSPHMLVFSVIFDAGADRAVSRIITFPTTTSFSLTSEVVLVSGSYYNRQVINNIGGNAVLVVYTLNTSTSTVRARVLNP